MQVANALSENALGFALGGIARVAVVFDAQVDFGFDPERFFQRPKSASAQFFIFFSLSLK